ncbi:MAG: ABC transporter ATP-binding protein [Deltaproteobacteria bacterium RBG_13_43_22]|nr:MAG: ABC transporter ATP-binding protein [Deltaproteobacteria bacterium RBG_13_43_22]
MLRVEGLSVSYGDARVLEGISFQVKPGAMTCILGPNGAGKTTLLRSITGIIPSVVGKVWFLDQEIQGKKTHQIVELGMTMIPEGRRLWAPLSIQENLELGAYRISDQRIVKERLSWVYDLFPHLAERKGQLCGTLSGGEQQMVSIGRGLMASPKLMMMDEPSLGLAPLIVREVFEAIKKIVLAGTTVLLIEQNTKVALSAAQYGYVLERGAIVMEGEAAALQEDVHIKQAYLGL